MLFLILILIFYYVSLKWVIMYITYKSVST